MEQPPASTAEVDLALQPVDKRIQFFERQLDPEVWLEERVAEPDVLGSLQQVASSSTTMANAEEAVRAANQLDGLSGGRLRLLCDDAKQSARYQALHHHGRFGNEYLPPAK